MACTLGACQERARPPVSTEASTAERRATRRDDGARSFPPFTLAPYAVDHVPATLAFASTARVAGACPLNDGALMRVAERIVGDASLRSEPIDSERLDFMLRSAGSPYVWARAWSLEGGALADEDVAARLLRWLASFGDAGERRCGMARRRRLGRDVVAVVAVDAAANLRPTPTTVRPGQWVDIRSSLLVPASDAKVVVVGPDEVPRSVPTSFANGEVRSRFNADRPGAWRAQLLATVSGGPRPVLEIVTFAGMAPPRHAEHASVPGEVAGEASLDVSDALCAMLNQARAAMGLHRLQRDVALDRLAQDHAEAMRDARRLAHDTGRGNATTRANAALANIVVGGENIAHATTVRQAHRTLWQSPSHRGNMLSRRFAAVGIGVAEDEDGSLWVCELFSMPARALDSIGH